MQKFCHSASETIQSKHLTSFKNNNNVLQNILKTLCEGVYREHCEFEIRKKIEFELEFERKSII